MKILTDFKTVVDGDNVTITAKIVEGISPFPMMQNTVMHQDDDDPRHITHLQMSNHGFFVKLPNKKFGVGIPAEQFILNVARVIEPGLVPAEPTKPIA